MKDLAAVIVTHNSASVIGACVDACQRQRVEVIVVDNASGDATIEEVRKRPAVRLIANKENRGFAAAVNQGFAAASHPLLLLLNPDTVVETSLEALRAACLRPDAGAATGRLISADGSFQRGFGVRRLPAPSSLIFEVLGVNRLWPANPVNRRYRCLDLDETRSGTVEQPAGAFLMIRRSAWEAAGGMDESFFPLWFEDVDFCKRLLEKGYLIYYEAEVQARHLGAHSVRQIPGPSREFYWYASLLKYAGKHFSRPWCAVLSLAVVGGALLRLVTGIVLHRKVEPVRTYGKVIRLACRYLLSGGGRGRSSSGSRYSNQAQIHVL
ncbi:MAG: glycosyltransferase family 2 protein [Acidobacteria bacterium]|nr:glycosyltransferase family 2 protein [Acidobacteriota bacterium]